MVYGVFGGADGNGQRHRWRLLLHLSCLDTERRQEILTWAERELLPTLLPALESAPAPLWPITIEFVPPDDGPQNH